MIKCIQVELLIFVYFGRIADFDMCIVAGNGLNVGFKI